MVIGKVIATQNARGGPISTTATTQLLQFQHLNSETTEREGKVEVKRKDQEERGIVGGRGVEVGEGWQT